MRRCPTSPRVARSVTARVSTEPRPPRAEPGRRSMRWVMSPMEPRAGEAPDVFWFYFSCRSGTFVKPDTVFITLRICRRRWGGNPKKLPPRLPPSRPSHVPGAPFRCADRPALPSLGSRASGPGGVLLPSSRRDGVLRVFSICERRESCGGIERTLGKSVNQSNQRPWIRMVQPSILRVPKSLLQSSLPSWKAQS